MNEDATGSIISFFQLAPESIPPMPADKSVLSTLPLAAFQHCEAVRVASGLGWYVFPAADAVLRYDGRTVFFQEEDGLSVLDSLSLGEGFEKHWADNAPAGMEEDFIPWLSALETSGIVQVWSGFCVSTAPGWGLYVKPISNYHSNSTLIPFEGIIQSDSFTPCPLFVNMRLAATDTDIVLSRTAPLFQVFAIPNTVPVQNRKAVVKDAFAPTEKGATGFDWSGYNRIIRDADSVEPSGSYGAEIRRRDRDRSE